MEKDELTYRIIGCAMKVHNMMGPGFQEDIYQRCLAIELARSGLAFHREKEQTVYYEKIEVGTRRADFVVEEKVIIEIKALVKLEDVHIAQAKNYTVAYDFPLGLLINFGGKSLEYKLLFNPKFYPVPNSANSVNSDSDMLPNPNPQKMARKSRLEPTFEPADAFIGIATNLPVTQLVHFINRETMLKLVREEDLPVFNEKTESLNYFKFFHYEDDDFRSDFCLVNNTSEGMNLLSTHKQFSYFLVVHGAIPGEKVKQLMAQIKSIAGVQLAALIKQEPVTALSPILQDLELHLTDLKKEKAEQNKRIMPSAEEQ